MVKNNFTIRFIIPNELGFAETPQTTKNKGFNTVIKDNNATGSGVFSQQPEVRLLYAEIMKNRERILEAFIAETGLKPSEIEMVQINDYDKIRWYVQKREVTE